MFHDALENILEDRPLEQTLDLIARRVTEIAGFDFCAIVLPDAAREHLHVAGAYNFPPRYLDRANLVFANAINDLQLSPTARAFAEHRTVIVTDTLDDPTYAEWRPLAVEFGFRSIVCVPMTTHGRPVGVLNGYARHPHDYPLDDLIPVENLARQASLALRVTMLVEDRQQTIGALQTANRESERQQEILERAHEIHLGFTDAVLHGADSAAVVSILARLLGRGAVVAAGDGEVNAHSEPRPAWATGPIDPQDPRLIRAPIRIRDETVGTVLVEDGTDETRALDRRAVEHAATVLALHESKTRAARAAEARLRSDFLGNVLQGRDPEERVREQAPHYGLRFGHEHRVVRLLVDDPGATAAPPGHTRHERIGNAVVSAVQQRHPTALISHVGNVLTVAVPLNEVAPAERLPATRSLATQIGQVVRRRVPGTRVIAGIGGAAREPADFVDANAQAERCVRLLERLERWDEVAAIDDLGLLGLFVEHERPERLVAMSEEILGPVIGHDETSASPLIDTLTTYIDAGCDLRATAAAMYVHVNTVKYRLRRIESLCGVTLRLTDDLLKLRIALLARQVLGPAA